jgi:hypothetical protein
MIRIEGRGTLDLPTFRKALSANPVAHSLSVLTELACGPLLGHALSDCGLDRGLVSA